MATRAKRKASYPADARPQKQHRSWNGKVSAGDNTPDGEVDNNHTYGPDSDSEMDTANPSQISAMLELPHDSLEWQETIERVVPTVVSIRFCQPCSFDTEFADTSEATGFVVDAERGYILTNRHVVNAGPFWGYCVFDNHEEVDAYPVYRDPVHDFGILRFDPKAIKYMPVTALQIRPDLAKVGIEIRVVGNDAGEKLCILSGVISRLDRNAPDYQEGYSDFNTCYYQANAAATGGSSGSPVVNIDGHAIAIQAGGRTDGASTDYFLPSTEPPEPCAASKKASPSTGAPYNASSFSSPLTSAAASRTRRRDCVAGRPSDNKIEEGDVLIKVNGELLTQFIRLDEILDDNVGQMIQLLLQRGGEDVEVEIEVGDLHKITPDRFLTVAGAQFHDLSYQQARMYAVACKGVYVCDATGSFRFNGAENGWIIESVDHKKTPNLDAFIEVMKAIPDRARIVVTYKHLRDLHTLNTSVIYIDRHWSSKMKMAVRNDQTGLWDFEEVGKALPRAPVTRSASFIQLEHTSHPAVADLVRSFVHVNCNMPLKLDGFPKNRKWGMGLVIDAEKGLVIISRAVVPYDLCDITITIADSIVMDGKVVFMHPLQNYAVVQYDPKLVDAPVQSARLGNGELAQGAATHFIGYNRIGRIVHAATTVTEITAVAIPANSGAPRYRAVNVDAITVDTNLAAQCGSGVLVGTDGTVQALWLTYLGEHNSCASRDEEYHLGLATPTLLPVVSQIQQGIVPKLRMLSVEFRAIHMAQARVMGVSEEWIKKVSEANKSHHQLFMVSKRTFERGPAGRSALLEGDILLTLNGKIITKVSELDVMYSHEVLDAVIVRNCDEIQMKANTVLADDVETDHAIWFCGAILHRPHHAVRQQISKLPSEVYVSARTRGSPAYQYGLAPTNFITHVNGKPTKDLDTFLATIREIPDNTYFRLKAVTFDCVPWVVTMKKNDHYFPTVDWIKDASDPCGWRRVTYESGQVIQGDAVDGVDPDPANAEVDAASAEA
ncbi:unnamed protein product [Parascedosporium putredinis]|uniref:Pro-apoptotic serine protease NMA111 n=1 Tax=Parascedosporium putredinis TaxID=1442378 RepID=A0A9P1M7J9_9PEZI|nr:unnamed protein product [Parascedosporium putredinis]CAI7987778.1 unnamed protein product [Parascedosporium putredinis]